MFINIIPPLYIVKYYIKVKDWEKIAKIFENINKNLCIYVDMLSLDWKTKDYVGFIVLKKSFLTILSINNIGVIQK